VSRRQVAELVAEHEVQLAPVAASVGERGGQDDEPAGEQLGGEGVEQPVRLEEVQLGHPLQPEPT
jgi:hypothetical protein